MKRRDVLRGTGGVAVALLAGQTKAVQAQNDPETPFALVPDPDALDDEYVHVMSTDLADADSEEDLIFETQVVAEIDDLAIEDVDEVVTAQNEDFEMVAAVAGAFERPEPGEEHDERDGWRIADDSDTDLAIASRDDLAAAASGDEDERLERVETAVDASLGEVDTAREAHGFIDTVFDRLGDNNTVYYLGDLQGFHPTDAEIDGFGAGFEVHPNELAGTEGKVENEYLLDPVDDLTVEDVEKAVEELETGVILELDAEIEDGLGVAEAVVEAPPERDQDASPDADVRLETDVDDGTATFEHTGGEAIPLDELELWVNGEQADTQPADELSGNSFVTDESFTVDTGPLASVLLRWTDEDEHIFHDYAWDTIGDDAFEVDFDMGAGTVEITYTADTAADPDRLQLEHNRLVEEEENSRRYEAERLTDPIDALGEALEPGDTITAEGIGVRDRVRLELDVPPRPPNSFVGQPTLARFRARPPRVFVRQHTEDGPVLSFRTETEHDADEFQILIDGAEADTQPADQHDTIETSDTVELDEVELGTKLVVEWLEPDEPLTVTEHVVEPHGRFDVAYDDSEGTMTLELTDGDTVDADDLELRVNAEPADTQPADEHDVFEPGDELEVQVAPFEVVNLVWIDGDHESMLTRQTVGRDLFEATYDPDDDSIELAYVGEQEADPEPLSLSAGRSELDENRISEEFDTLTDGDSITIEDVEPDTWVRVVLRTESDGHHHHRTLFSFRPKPSRPFSFESTDDTLVAQYYGDERDADELRILADGDETDTQPADEFDTLEDEDELELGSFDTGTELVVEWTVPDEPVEVQTHDIVPAAEFDVEFDADDEELRLTHDGGDAIDADDLDVFADFITDDPVDWDGEGTVEEGDSMVLDAEREPEMVFVLYREREPLHEERFDD